MSNRQKKPNWLAKKQKPTEPSLRDKLSANFMKAFEADWPAPGSEDTELGVLMELEVGHGETEVHAGVQA
jgi:hypothetical protein